MNKQLTTFSIASLAMLLLTFAVSNVAEARHKDLRWEYHLGSELLGCGPIDPNADPIDPIPGTPTCRPEAKAEVFAGPPVVPGLPTLLEGEGTIAIQGSGELSIRKDGRPKRVRGGGTFAQYDASGGLLRSGKWKAKKLLLFDSYGPKLFDPPPPLMGPPEHFEAGRVLIRISLHPDGEKSISAVIEIGCRLGPLNPGIPGTIEGTRVMVEGGLYYNIPADPKSTLFVNLQTAP